MERPAKKEFLDLRDAEIADYLLMSDAGRQIPSAYLADVIDNLRLLHRHALLVVAAAPTDASGAANIGPAVFEP